jgi:hypothetical protein
MAEAALSRFLLALLVGGVHFFFSLPPFELCQKDGALYGKFEQKKHENLEKFSFFSVCALTFCYRECSIFSPCDFMCSSRSVFLLLVWLSNSFTTRLFVLSKVHPFFPTSHAQLLLTLAPPAHFPISHTHNSPPRARISAT